MSAKLQAPRGTHDLLPADAARRQAIEDAARRIFGAAGYQRVETPAFEATELFARGVGTSTDIVQKEMYTFEDGGGRSLTLRPEGTAPVCRAYIEHGMSRWPQPVKLWYLSSFFRYERAQAGRQRQFWQVGSEAIGSADPALDAESIVLLAELLDALGCRGVRLRLSSLGTSDTRAAYREELQAYLRAHEERLSEEVRGRIDSNPLRAFDADHPGTREVMAGAPLLLDRLTGEDAEHFAEVRRLLDGADLSYEIDPTLVRGLDYYARTVFEFTSDALGAQSGVGWAAGIERMLLAAGEQAVPEPVVDLFVAYAGETYRAAGFQIAHEARRAGLAAQLEQAGRSLKGQLKQADRIGARYVAILGEEGATVKEMESGEQETVEPGAIVHHVLRGRSL